MIWAFTRHMLPTCWKHGNLLWVCACYVVVCACAGSPTSQSASGPVTSDSSWALLPFKKLDSVNPILVPGAGEFLCPISGKRVRWEIKNVLNPAVVIKDGKIVMLYRAQDSAGTSRIGIAESLDGIHFRRDAEPVLFPSLDAQKKYEWPGGCEDPRVVKGPGELYYLTYTGYDGHQARLMMASSMDLRHWTKLGPAFAKAYDGKYLNAWSKSGSIISRYENGSPVAVRLRGAYWMYWGDQFIWPATSQDLVNWVPQQIELGEKPSVALKGNAMNLPDLRIALATRKGKFDCDLVESGPPAMLTKEGILLIYNGRNQRASGDTTLDEGTYAAGQVLLDSLDPNQTRGRLPGYFLRPDRPYEMKGQVDKVCFIEGLVQWKKTWFLYYGTADSRIAVAVNR